MKVKSRHKCFLHNVAHEVDVEETGYEMWRRGAAIQAALPKATDDEREILKSGTCQAAWDEMFPPESVDDLIDEYAKTLQQIYDKRTAVDRTFQGVLAEFARKIIRT
jgi:hypothetical protein